MTFLPTSRKLFKGHADIGVALFLFARNFFLFLLPLYEIGEASKKENLLACVYVRAYRRFIYISFYFFFYFFFIKRKVSEEMPFNSEFWERNSNNFRKNVLNFRRNNNNFGKNGNKWARNFGEKSLKNTQKSACFLTSKINAFLLVST